MTHNIGIRREDKNKWERRVPITPRDMAGLIRDSGLRFAVQPSPIRVFPDEEFRRAGARIQDGLDGCGVIFAVKEVPQALFREGVTYVFFSHTTKGQAYNMDMLRRLFALRCNLIDYERIVDAQKQRLIFFGRHAGLAGMIDTLWGLGKRLAHQGIRPNPLEEMLQSHRYPNLDRAVDHLHRIAARISRDGFAEAMAPFVIGLTGYGNVSRGAQEILDCLPVEAIEPEALPQLFTRKVFNQRKIYKVVFREEHMVKPIREGGGFDLLEYYNHPERYCSAFDTYWAYLSVLVNCIYWDTPYPRLITKASLQAHFAAHRPIRLQTVGDISCDIEGAIEFTTKATEPDNPVYVYEPEHDRSLDGVEGHGPLVMAVDNLPCEFPREASEHFSRALTPFLPAIAAADYTVSFEQLDLPDAIKNAMLVYQGNFTPDFQFMEGFLTS